FVAPPLLQPSRTAAPPPPAAATLTAPPRAERGLAQYREPVALLRALRLTVTPSNVALARIALETPQKLPNVLATLEAALPDSADGRVTTLRTLAAFVAELDPASPVLDTQVAAYVAHVLTAAEPKLAQTLLAGGNGDVPRAAERATAL
ncbi:MAG: hypothetical protein ABR591_14390, partial [Candidatus Velthaea sp.]